MIYLFNTILYEPIFNFLVFLYNILPITDFGLAIILLTVIIRLIFLPLSLKTLKSQRLLNKLQPQIKQIQEKFKDDRARQTREIMNLYKISKVSPFSGCLPLLIQLPVLLALYQALISGLKPEDLKNLYSFVGNPGTINKISLGFFDLSTKSPILAFLAGFSQYIQTKFSFLKTQSFQSQTASQMAILNKQMLYFFPVMIIIIGWNLPAGLVLYWLITTVLSIFEQIYINKKTV